ncbi:hypothetical protein EST38_g1575 [Candolleomyces aberdarensis]|uniref:Uncharacterized protein n=1 Tax=Candolleomyces aberdarensis TaxID=2316362 RepID=A0A4Q2DVG4_9AGAR|nr:hypothetical protein EST38_g1575 [Candolleomyces aberdarensis]
MGILPLDPHQLSDHIANLGHGAPHGRGASDVPTPPPETDSSPISRLPPELLAEIFLCCLPEGRFPAPCVTAAPLLPAHICKAWRSVALSTPELWSAIHLHHRNPLQDVRIAHLWLAHSGNRPLSLSLSIDFDERPQQAILNLICRYSKRWEHVRFKFRQLLCPPMYDLELAMGNVPMLSTFEFHARDVSACNILPIRRLLSSAPHLKEISWVDDLADAETLLALPLSRLARLSLSIHYGSLDYIELLDQCANLEHIRITRPGPDIRPSPRAPPVLLPKLTSLNIAHDLTGILDHLTLPALKHVRVQLDADNGGGDTRYSRLMSVPTADMIGAATSPLMLSDGAGQTWDPKGLIQLIESVFESVQPVIEELGYLRTPHPRKLLGSQRYAQSPAALGVVIGASSRCGRRVGMPLSSPNRIDYRYPYPKHMFAGRHVAGKDGFGVIVRFLLDSYDTFPTANVIIFRRTPPPEQQH